MIGFQEKFSDSELAILRSRAERIATPIQSETLEESLTVLSVIVRAERFALPMDAISVVYDDVQITPVPNMPPFALGITNVRGHIIVVLDLGTILGVPGASTADGKWAIVVLDGDLGIAFQADSIEGIESLPTGHLTTNIPNLNLVRKSYLQGLSPNGTALLNVQSILDDLVAVAQEIAE